MSVLKKRLPQHYSEWQQDLYQENIQNFQQVLSHIEGVEIGPFTPPLHNPQLIVLDFKLDKKNGIWQYFEKGKLVRQMNADTINGNKKPSLKEKK